MIERKKHLDLLMLNDQIKKIIVVNRPIKECLDENGFTIIGVIDFLLKFI